MTNSDTTNTNPEQNKAPLQAPGTEVKTPEQLALDKKNEKTESAPSTEQKDGNSSEKKA
jgi:hypothetical protein